MAIFLLSNLTKLRWFAFAGIAICLVLGDFVFDLAFVSHYSWLLLLFYGLSNFFLKHPLKKHPGKSLLSMWVLMADSLFLTCFILLNGGSHNPFAILFISIASIAAMTLSQKQFVTVCLTCLLGLGSIYSGLFDSAHIHHQMPFPFHLSGMWVANSLAVMMGSYWVYKLRARQETLEKNHREAQSLLAKLEHLNSMNKLAATTAHKLNTHLGTLQLGISELADPKASMEDQLKKEWLQDLQTALNKIKMAISELQTDNSQISPLANQKESFFELITQACDHWSKPRKQEMDLLKEGPDCLLPSFFLAELSDCLYTLLDNALEATFQGMAKIHVTLTTSPHQIRIRVTDKGSGIDGSVRERLGEPFITTKTEGKGLGLYATQNMVNRYQGQLLIESIKNEGTTITLIFETKYFNDKPYENSLNH